MSVFTYSGGGGGEGTATNTTKLKLYSENKILNFSLLSPIPLPSYASDKYILKQKSCHFLGVFFFFPMPPHVLVDFVVLPPGHGRSVTDF